MHPLLNQDIARLHREELWREAVIERSLAQHDNQESIYSLKQYEDFFKPIYNRTTFLYGQPAVLQSAKYNAIALNEIRQELRLTLSAARETDPESDDYRIESFIRKLRNELAPEGEVLLVKRLTPIHRVVLALTFLCMLMPLLGMTIGISQGILIGAGLFCLAVVILSVILRLI